MCLRSGDKFVMRHLKVYNPYLNWMHIINLFSITFYLSIYLFFVVVSSKDDFVEKRSLGFLRLFKASPVIFGLKIIAESRKPEGKRKKEGKLITLLIVFQ